VRRLGAFVITLLMALMAVGAHGFVPRGGAGGVPTRMVFATSDLAGNGSVNIWNLYGGKPTVLASCGVGECYPSPSPNNAQIAYQAAVNGVAIYIMGINGSSQTRLSPTPGFDVRPNWSPDGTKIVFNLVTGTSPTTSAIWTMNPDGSGRTMILADGGTYNIEARYSPDGTKITFMSGRSGTQQIWVMNADGSNLTQLTTIGVSGEPGFSPDGTLIVFGSTQGTSNVNLYTMHPDGTNITQLTHYVEPLEAGDASWYGNYLSWEWDNGGESQSQPNVPAYVFTMTSTGAAITSTGQFCASVGCHPTWIGPP
jgi:Tol biopolymer transport system component